MNILIGLVAALALAFVFGKVGELIRERTGFTLGRVPAIVVGVVLVVGLSALLRLTGLPREITDGLALGPVLGLYIGLREPPQANRK